MPYKWRKKRCSLANIYFRDKYQEEEKGKPDAFHHLCKSFESVVRHGNAETMSGTCYLRKLFLELVSKSGTWSAFLDPPKSSMHRPTIMQSWPANAIWNVTPHHRRAALFDSVKRGEGQHAKKGYTKGQSMQIAHVIPHQGPRFIFFTRLTGFVGIPRRCSPCDSQLEGFCSDDARSAGVPFGIYRKLDTTGWENLYKFRRLLLGLHDAAVV